MKKSKYTEQHIACALRQAEAGTRRADHPALMVLTWETVWESRSPPVFL